MDEPSTDICAHHIERMLRAHGAVSHAGLVLREHHNRRIADLEACIRLMQRAVPGGDYVRCQEIADDLREIAARHGVNVDEQ